MIARNRGEINSIAVHPSGKLCFSVARDRTLRMWNLVKGRIAYIRRLEKEANLVILSQKGSRYALCFGSDLSVFSSSNAEVRSCLTNRSWPFVIRRLTYGLWCPSPQLIGTLEHKQRIQCAVFATDDYIVCAGDDKHIYIWQATGNLVAKVTHADLTARIRCMQVLYVNGENALPWIVLATSNGTVQIWDLAAFKFDALAPEEANAEVVPVTSTTLLSKPRLTCLTACLSNEGVEVPDAQKKVKKAKKPSSASVKATVASKAAAAAAPRVVVELDGDAAKNKRKAEDKQPQQQKQGGGKNKNKKSKKPKTA